MNNRDKRLLGELADVAHIVSVVIGVFLLFHFVTGGKWQKAQRDLGWAAVGLQVAARL